MICDRNFNGNFIKYSDLTNEFDDYHHNWELDEKLNEIGVQKKKNLKLPELFVELIKGVIDKDSEIIKDCCEKFYSNYRIKN